MKNCFKVYHTVPGYKREDDPCVDHALSTWGSEDESEWLQDILSKETTAFKSLVFSLLFPHVLYPCSYEMYISFNLCVFLIDVNDLVFLWNYQRNTNETLKLN